MYGKLFASAFTGSLMGSGGHVFSVWAYVIAHTVDSQVEINPRLVALLIGIPEDSVMEAIHLLCAPDPRSRTKEFDGKRLIREGEYAYRVPNHAAYNGIRNENDRREYNRTKKRESRAKLKGETRSTSTRESMTVNDMSTMSAHKEAEAEAEEQEELKPPAAKIDKVDVVCVPKQSAKPIAPTESKPHWALTDAEIDAGVLAPPSGPDGSAHVSDFLSYWQTCPEGVNGVARVYEMPETLKPGEKPTPLQVSAIDRAAILGFWPSRKPAAIKAMDCIRNRAINWGRSAMTIAQFANEIDGIIGGTRRRPDQKVAARTKRTKVDDIEDMLSDTRQLANHFDQSLAGASTKIETTANRRIT